VIECGKRGNSERTSEAMAKLEFEKQNLKNKINSFLM